jgi:hypothetical protein
MASSIFCVSAVVFPGCGRLFVEPVRGILTFLVAPAFLAAGLVIFLFGAWRWRRRLIQSNGAAPALHINVDLSRAHDRRLLAFFVPPAPVFFF